MRGQGEAKLTVDGSLQVHAVVAGIAGDDGGLELELVCRIACAAAQSHGVSRVASVGWRWWRRRSGGARGGANRGSDGHSR